MKKHIKKTDAAVFAAVIPEETMLDIAGVVKEAAWAERHRNDLPEPENAAMYERMHTTPLVMWVENGHMFAARHITTVTDFNVYARTLCWKDGKPCSLRQIKKSLKRIRAAHAARKAAEDPVSVGMLAYFPLNKGDSKIRRERKLKGYEMPTKKPDLDNILKICLDGLQGEDGAFEDDCQVIFTTCAKLYDAVPRVELSITELMPPDC